MDPWDEVSDGEECKFGGMGLTDSEEEERGRLRKRRQGCGRSEHAVDTLPTLMDTSVVNVEENSDGSWSGSHLPGPAQAP